MINILILLLFLGIYKVFVLIGFGYYTFRHDDKPDCYAPDDSRTPQFKRYDDGDVNVSREFMLVFQFGFWLCMLQAFLFFPSIKSTTVQKLLCVLIIPDIALFIFMNVVVFQMSSRVCTGEFINEAQRQESENYLLTSEHHFLFISALCMWAIVAFAVCFIGCVHTCYTFCFRV